MTSIKKYWSIRSLRNQISDRKQIKKSRLKYILNMSQLVDIFVHYSVAGIINLNILTTNLSAKL